MLLSKLVEALLAILSLLLRWVPFLGPLINRVRMKREFVAEFGVHYWVHDAKEVAEKKMESLKATWAQNGYNPNRNKKYARAQKIAGYLDRLRG